jgi:DNA invertase Pin-like site-specific DNA recombinase
LTGPVIKRRCAVYTRKSTDEGLDMAFNSLDAQRDACEAYIASQRGEGWVLVADRYDDGGFGVTSRSDGLSVLRPLCPWKRTFLCTQVVSAPCQFRTSCSRSS